jgi:hypothetical protein
VPLSLADCNLPFLNSLYTFHIVAAYLCIQLSAAMHLSRFAKEYVNGMAQTIGIASVWAVLKRGFYGVYQRSVKGIFSAK